MRRAGPIDGRGRLMVAVVACSGLALGAVLGWFVLGLVGAPWSTPQVGAPAAGAVLVAIVFVWLLLRTWRGRGGYRRSRELDGWLRRRRAPTDVPAGQWQPALERIAARSGQALVQSLLAVLWIAYAVPALLGDRSDPAAVPLTLLWIASLAYHLGWVLPRARAARRILGRGVTSE